MKTKKEIRIPKFRNESEEAEWWASKDGRAFLSQKWREAEDTGALRKGHPPAVASVIARRANAVPIHIRIAPEDLAKAKQIAERKGLPYQTYIKTLLHEALEEVK